MVVQNQRWLGDDDSFFAAKAYRNLLEVQRRVEVINTVVTIANIGWVRLQQLHADAEQSFREALAILARTAPSSWERFNMDSMLGASLVAQRKFEEAEPLLISGYDGMRSAERATNAANTSRFTQDQAGDAIVQLYADWANPQSKPSGRKNSKPARTPRQHQPHRSRNCPLPGLQFDFEHLAVSHRDSTIRDVDRPVIIDENGSRMVETVEHNFPRSVWQNANETARQGKPRLAACKFHHIQAAIRTKADIENRLESLEKDLRC
jgi:hypothetical protein